MQADIVKIGNSQGLRLPKTILKQCGFSLDKPVTLEVEGNRLIICAVDAARQGWDESFQAMALAGDEEALLDGTLANRFDEDEWTW